MSCTHVRAFFERKNIEKSISRTYEIYFLYKLVSRWNMPRVNFLWTRALYYMFLRYFFYKSRILALLQTLIKASEHHQKSKKLISQTCEKSFIWKLVGLSRMLPVTFQRNPTQISRCTKKLFSSSRKSLLSPSNYRGIGPVHADFFLNFFDFSNMWSTFSIKIGELVEDYT